MVVHQYLLFMRIQKKTMKCPKCKRNISHAIVISECRQEGYFDEGTNKLSKLEGVNDDDIAHYMSEVTKVIRIVCPECDAIITKAVNWNELYEPAMKHYHECVEKAEKRKKHES